MKRLLLILLLAGCGGNSSRRTEAPDSTAADAALEACARGDVDAAEALLRDAKDPDSVRLRARYLMMRNRNREAIDLLTPLLRGKAKDYETMERRNHLLPDLVLACIRQDDFRGAASVAALQGDASLSRKYEALARTVAYSSNLGADAIAVELFVTDPLPIVAGTVNGRRATFVVDTMLDELILDRDFARRAGVTQVYGAEDAILPEISFGKLTVKNVPIHLGQAMEIGNLRPEGAIGLQFLMHYDFTLDYRRSKLVFRRAGGTVAGQPAVLVGDRYLLTSGLLNGKDRTFIGIGSSLKGVTLAVSEFSGGDDVRELTAGSLKLAKPALDPKAFPAGLDGSFGVPVGFVLGHSALRARSVRLEPRSMKLAIE